MMITFNKFQFLFAIAAFYISCTAIPTEELFIKGSNPGYSTFLISAPERLSKDVSINGFIIDTTDINSVRKSVETILQSECQYKLVVEKKDTDADIIIDFTNETSFVPETYYGINAIINSKSHFPLPKYIELAKHTKIDIVRFGHMRCRYDRSLQSTAEDYLGEEGSYHWRLTGEDIENFIHFCRATGAIAEPELNLITNNPDMWADMIDQIVNELGYDLKYISPGNEPENTSESDWEEMGVSSFNESLVKYTQNFIKTRAAIEKVKKGIVYPFFEAGQHKNPELIDNLDIVLNALDGIDPGALSVHWYPLGGWEGQSTNHPSYPSIEHLVLENNQGHEINYLSIISSTIEDKANDYGLLNTLKFIGEWNPAWSAGNISMELHESMASVVFGAEVLEYCKILGFDSVQYFDLSDPEEWENWRPGLIGVSNDLSTMSVRPIYYLYFMYKYFYGNQFIKISGGRHKDWSIYASKDDKHNYIMLINRTEEKIFHKTVYVKSSGGSKTLELTIYPRAVTIIGFDH